jgi:hypothetical protein
MGLRFFERAETSDLGRQRTDLCSLRGRERVAGRGRRLRGELLLLLDVELLKLGRARWRVVCVWARVGV